MAKNSSIGLDVTRLPDGFYLYGGATTKRKLQVADSNVQITDTALSFGATMSEKVFSFPAATDTLVGIAAQQTLTNKTLTSPKINLGSDACGDIYYRSYGTDGTDGVLTRLAVGSVGNLLTLATVGGHVVPTWSSGVSHAQNTDTGTTNSSFAIDSDGNNAVLTANAASLGVSKAMLVLDDTSAAIKITASDADTLSIFKSDGVIGANLVVGNLTVNGTTTTINSTTITVDDKNIELGSVASPDDTTASGGGITLKGTTDKTIIWDNSTDKNWTLNQNVNVPTSYVYKINNVSVLSATTLGANVVSSSLTSVGTLTSGTWNASVIDLAHGGTNKNMTAVAGGVVYTDADSMEVTAAGVSGQVLVSNGSSAPSWANLATSAAANYEVLTADATIDEDTVSLKKIVNKSGSACVITVAATLPVGREIVVAGLSADGWQVVAEASSSVKFVFGDVESAADGSISSTYARDAVTLVKVSATEIMVVSSVGNLDLV